MEEQPFEPTDGIGRRAILKKAGAGAALLWAAPAVASVASGAASASGAVCEQYCNCTANPASCPSGGLVACGSPGCRTLRTAEGDCFCAEGFSVGACVTSADCPAGSRCVPDTCIGTICQPECGAGAASAVDPGQDPNG